MIQILGVYIICSWFYQLWWFLRRIISKRMTRFRIFSRWRKNRLLLLTSQPDYPQSAIDAGINGIVVVKVVVDKNGNVTSAEIFRSIPRLDNAALQTARRKVFSPGQVNGSPVNAEMNIPIVFNLADVPSDDTGDTFFSSSRMMS